MKKVLVIEENTSLREYIRKKLQEFGLKVIIAVNGLDGKLKIRNELPDLVIMDYHLSRLSSIDLLKSKMENPNASHIPVLMTLAKADKKKILELHNYNVKKIIPKPIQFDAFLQAVSEYTDVQVSIDQTPSIIEAHMNEDILFIEIAQGLNQEKIELLRYKIQEILELYNKDLPKVLIMLSGVPLEEKDTFKVETLFQVIFDTTRTRQSLVKVLTNSEFVKTFLESHEEYYKVETVNNLPDAIDSLLKKDQVRPKKHDDKMEMTERILSSSESQDESESEVQLRFAAERVEEVSEKLNQEAGEIKIAAVDDDEVITSLLEVAFSETSAELNTFSNGEEFIRALANTTYDLLLLDIMMPKLDGFQVLEIMNKKNIRTPVIILSSLTQKETVLKARQFGAKSYMRKPLKPERVIQKALEVLGTTF
ncbi:MAG: response regulator [Spirochaetia bacterium]